MMNTNKSYEPLGDAEDRAFARENLVYNVTEDLLIFLEDNDISKKELARRLGKSKSYITQILSGSRNMTLGSFSDICFSLGFKPEIKIPVQEETVAEKAEFSWGTFERKIPCSNTVKKLVKRDLNVIDMSNPEHWVKAA
ncbi:helix-turn-helix domain-containing protein [Photobacterium damselae subsp. damselae]|uniref:helix-turn-helix domain-containing protein n=1 Tax=Photobacterium damselae TaxID=38293 RepID=UPI001F412B35|nr:helix-turn-helix transcriptional regulator [Photobacterium damselae]UJZ96477.1 helix-turn-helix domain-containing protein [Photobacterium damselae subsp. damselae]UJZ99618.1 helix-turn-helix domain-containing protein [Photobacterium damselae subsp. damselae]